MTRRVRRHAGTDCVRQCCHSSRPPISLHQGRGQRDEWSFTADFAEMDALFQRHGTPRSHFTATAPNLSGNRSIHYEGTNGPTRHHGRRLSEHLSEQSLRWASAWMARA